MVGQIWFEKYRPKKLEDLILSDEVRKELEICISENNIGNFLFHGQPGSGKTTLSMILASPNGVLKYPEDNLLAINGNAKSTRGIGYVDNVIEPFFQSPPSGDDKYKIVFIDECDSLTPEAFGSLRNLIESVTRHYGRFIWTCNYIHKIPEPIRSRFQIYNFKSIDFDSLVNQVKMILDSEKVEYDINDVSFICENLYPDMRRIINLLEQHSRTKKLVFKKDEILFADKEVKERFIKLCSLILTAPQTSEINSISKEIIQIINDTEVNYYSLYNELFNSPDIPGPVKILINRYSNSHSDCVFPPMHFASLVFETIECLVRYVKITQR